MTSWTMHVGQVKRLCRVIKAYNPAVKTFVGGEHTRISPADFAIPEMDFVFMGEAYESLPAVMAGLWDGSPAYKGVAGVAYQEGGEFYSNGVAVIPPSFDLDSLPFPDRSITSRYHGKYYHLWWKPIALVRTAMGCPSRCSFCNLWKVNLGKYLQWSPEYVVDYLRRLDAKYTLFGDDHFFGDANRAFRIGRAIEKSGIKKQYCLYSRADAIAKHPDLVELWARIGLRRVRMGLESYSDRILGEMNKCQSVEHNDVAVRTLQRHGVLTEGLFQIGLDFTRKDFEDMERYIRSRRIEVPNITVSTPMPGTPEFALQKDQMTHHSAEYFDFQHAVLPTKLDLKTYCRLYSRLMFRAQRPPLEQIREIGLLKFLANMPSFWRYFWSLRGSHRHYGQRGLEPASDPALLPWNNVTQNCDTREATLDRVESLYNTSK